MRPMFWLALAFFALAGGAVLLLPGPGTSDERGRALVILPSTEATVPGPIALRATPAPSTGTASGVEVARASIGETPAQFAPPD